jgi:hypothetical protein
VVDTSLLGTSVVEAEEIFSLFSSPFGGFSRIVASAAEVWLTSEETEGIIPPLLSSPVEGISCIVASAAAVIGRCTS